MYLCNARTHTHTSTQLHIGISMCARWPPKLHESAVIAMMVGHTSLDALRLASRLPGWMDNRAVSVQLSAPHRTAPTAALPSKCNYWWQSYFISKFSKDSACVFRERVLYVVAKVVCVCVRPSGTRPCSRCPRCAWPHLHYTSP